MTKPKMCFFNVCANFKLFTSHELLKTCHILEIRMFRSVLFNLAYSTILYMGPILPSNGFPLTDPRVCISDSKKHCNRAEI